MKIQFTGALLASALALAACGQGSSEPAKPADNAASAAPAAPAPGPAGAAAPVAPAAPEGSAAPAAVIQGQARQNFEIVNTTGYTVMTLNVAPTASDEWGPDILGRDTLANGETAQITFDRSETQCLFDIRVTYEDGDVSDTRGVDVCRVSTFTLTP
jgi:hypothetical protein